MTDRQTRKVKIRVAKAERSRTNNDDGNAQVLILLLIIIPVIKSDSNTADIAYRRKESRCMVSKNPDVAINSFERMAAVHSQSQRR